MKKNNIFMLIIGFLNFAICLSLLFLCVPNKIAFAVNFNEKIILLASKWVLIINVMLPILLAYLTCVFECQKRTKAVLTALFVLMIYENMLAFSYFSIEQNFILGTISQIPLAVSVFMPISSAVTIYAIKMKHLPFKSALGLKTKYTTKTEFIWKQAHFYASEIFFAFGVLSFLISIVFMFVRLSYINLIIYILGFISCYFIANKQAKDMYNKYIDMEKRKNQQKK